MRLTPDQRNRIVRTIRDRVGEDATVWLYGSRTADNRRGKDVDLLIRTSAVIDVQDQAILPDQLGRELVLTVDGEIAARTQRERQKNRAKVGSHAEIRPPCSSPLLRILSQSVAAARIGGASASEGCL